MSKLFTSLGKFAFWLAKPLWIAVLKQLAEKSASLSVWIQNYLNQNYSGERLVQRLDKHIGALQASSDPQDFWERLDAFLENEDILRQKRRTLKGTERVPYPQNPTTSAKKPS